MLTNILIKVLESLLTKLGAFFIDWAETQLREKKIDQLAEKAKVNEDRIEASNNLNDMF